MVEGIITININNEGIAVKCNVRHIYWLVQE